MNFASIYGSLHLALASSVIEFPCRVFNLGKMNRMDGPVWIWIDYPQAVTAGLIALSFFGRGIIGYAAAGIIITTTLVLKICREFEFAVNQY